MYHINNGNPYDLLSVSYKIIRRGLRVNPRTKNPYDLEPSVFDRDYIEKPIVSTRASEKHNSKI